PRPPTTSPTNRMFAAMGRDCAAGAIQTCMGAGGPPGPGPAGGHSATPPAPGPTAAAQPPRPPTQLTTQPMIRPVVIRRWVQAVLLPLALLGLWVLAPAGGTLVLVLVTAGPGGVVR